MKKLKLTKVIASTLIAASVLVLNPIGANAEWKQNKTGWWYTEGSSWAKGFRAIDGSLYYFDQKGYMLDYTPNEFGETYGINSSGQFKNVTIHGAWAFCKLTGTIVAYVGSDSNVVIPDKIDNVAVTGIGYKAFFQCNILTNITIPSSVKNIGRYAFYGCTNLTSINIPASVKFIEQTALSGCSSLANISVDNNNANYKSIDGVLYSKEPKIVYYPGGKEILSKENGIEILCYPAGKVDKNYTIPSNVESIEGTAFSGCKNLTSIVIPNSVIKIGYSAFEDCTGLTEINIPDSVTSIENGAFYGCTNLTSVNIPNGVTSIERGTFQNCTNLKNITIPNSITRIDISAFSECKNIMFYVKSEAMKQLLIKSGINASKIVLTV